MTKESPGFFEIFARLGFGARGAVYCLVGGLALLAAFGSGGQTEGSRSALQTLLAQPFGQVWLTLIAVGLFGFAAWRAVEGLLDADRRGNNWKALTVRAAHLVSGGIYASLALFAIGLVFGFSSGSAGDERAAQDWTAWLLGQPFGQWLVGIVGAAVVATGLGFLWKSWKGDVVDRLALPAASRDWIVLLGRMGFAARGVVFLLIGGFLIVAAIYSSSSDAQGLGGALRSLQGQPYGWILLGLTAAGLFAFGLYGLVQARYRRIDAPDLDEAAELALRATRP
jgi:hypothetical protein